MNSRLLYFLSGFLLLLCSCSSGQRVIDIDSRKIPYMTKLRVETINGTAFEMKVRRTDKLGIHGTKGEFVEFVKIKRLERIPYSPAEIMIANIFVVGTFALAWLGILLLRPGLL